jgi:hypothetical protein
MCAINCSGGCANCSPEEITQTEFDQILALAEQWRDQASAVNPYTYEALPAVVQRALRLCANQLETKVKDLRENHNKK